MYVDNDPVVLAHGRALLEENDQTHFSAADIFKPREVINDKNVRMYLDFSKPIALFQLGTLHHYEGERSPQSIMAEYVDALPSGSYVAISHFCDPETRELTELARKLEQIFVHSPLDTSGVFRTRAEIEGMCPGLELLEPGLIRCADWWPDGPQTKPGVYFAETGPFTLALALEQRGRTLAAIRQVPRVAVILATGSPGDPFLQAQATAEVVTGDAAQEVRRVLLAKVPAVEPFLAAPIETVTLRIETWRITDTHNGWFPGRELAAPQPV